MLESLRKSVHTFMLYLRVRFWQFKRFLRENFTANGRADRDLAAAEAALTGHSNPNAFFRISAEAESFGKASEDNEFYESEAASDADIEASGHMIDRERDVDIGWACSSCGNKFDDMLPEGGYPVCTGRRKTLSPRLQQAVDRMNDEDKELLDGFGDGRFAQLVSAAEAAAKVPAFYSHTTRVDSFPKAVKKTKSAKKRAAKKKSKSNKKAKK